MAQKVKIYHQKVVKIDEVPLENISSPKYGYKINLLALLPIVASRRYAIQEKAPPIKVSVDAGEGGAKGGTENVHSFVTFERGRLPLLSIIKPMTTLTFHHFHVL